MERREDHPDERLSLARALERLNRTLEQGHAELGALRQSLHEIRSQLRSARAHASDLEWELADLEHHLRDLRQQPDAQAREQELTSITERQALLEEQVLAQMLHVDELAAHYAAQERALAELERDWIKREAALLAEHQRLTELLRIEDGG